MAGEPPARPGPVVLGTAGHVDHGKSSLVLALTGIDPDRLAEEKARSLTIDLGFARLTLPGGRAASLVDVPGHERFIKNMLAGVGGIDAALLVIAADEGPMPQTREHLAILTLLGIEHAVVALTKRDLVDQDWLDLVQSEVEDLLDGTPLARVPIIPVSARTGAGLEDLRAALAHLAGEIPPRPGGDRPRLPVDRAFSVAGFGTVVTGTLSGGGLRPGQELRLYPGERPVRVRGLQIHNQPVDHAPPGSRVAVNLTGVTVDQVRRGDVLAPPGLLTPSLRLDARLRLLPEGDWPLAQNSLIDLFTGAAETPARVTLLDKDRLDPGEEAWVQLRLQHPVAVLWGDRYVIRRPSPSQTIGGGTVVDPNPPRHKRHQPAVLQTLATLATGGPPEVLLAAIAASPLPLPLDSAANLRGLSPGQVTAALAELRATNRVTQVSGERESDRATGYVMTTEQRDLALATALAELRAYHERYPLRRGLPVQTLRGQLGLPPPVADAAIASFAAAGHAALQRDTVRLPGFSIRFSPEQQALVDHYLARLVAEPYTPPTPTAAGLNPELAAALEHLGQVVRIGPDLMFAPEVLDHLVRTILEMIDTAGPVSLGQVRDQFQTTRRYAQAILEYLDRQRLTRRIGDERIRFTPPSATAPTAPPAPPEGDQR